MPERNYVILFADIAGSMHLYNQLGDEAAKTLILQLQQQQSTVIEAASGNVQEFIGDEVMARFTDCEAAVAASNALHELATRFSNNAEAEIEMRIGLHYGPAIIEAGRMFGDTVNIASRVAAIARGAQTITTQALLEQLPPYYKSSARHYDVTTIKGKYGLLDIYELTWESSGQTTMMLTRDDRTGRGKLILSFGATVNTLDLRTENYCIGRADSNDLIVHGNSVSRQHISIEVARGRFVVCDNSTNGTYVYLSNSEVIYLRRERLPVWGQGKIALGAPLDDGKDHILDYRHSSD